MAVTGGHNAAGDLVRRALGEPEGNTATALHPLRPTPLFPAAHALLPPSANSESIGIYGTGH